MFKQIFSPSRLIFIVGTLFLVTYLLMMLVKPWVDGQGNWQYVHQVWLTWQTLNAAMIAFSASLIALYAARYYEEQKRKRQLLAAKAMLPQALTELTAHVESLTSFYSQTKEYWQQSEQTINEETKPCPPNSISSQIEKTFSSCMIVAPTNDVEFMANILSMSQYICSRATSEYEDTSIVRESYWQLQIDWQLLELAEMHSRTIRLLEYARNLNNELNITPLTRKELTDSLMVLNVHEGRHSETYNQMAKKYGKSNYDPDEGWH